MAGPKPVDRTELGTIAYQAEVLGHSPGSEEYEHTVTRLTVERCRALKHMQHCSKCAAYNDCALIKQHMRDQQGM